jgi:hypothetical protein
MVMADDGHLGEQSGLFEITVGDSPRWVCLQEHELGLAVVREWESPDVPLPRSIKVDASHTNFGRISGSQERGCLGNHFR